MVKFLRYAKNILSVPLQKSQWIRMSRCSSRSSSDVILDNKGLAGIITLNRPKALNALNTSMIQAIYPKLKEWQSDKQLIIIKSAVEKAFCAGGDIRAVTEAGKKELAQALKFFESEYHLNYLIGSLKIPYIAFIQGITMGGGVGLSVHGDYRIATEKTVFAMPETAIGLFPDVGGSHFLSRLPNQLGTFLGLTGVRLLGQDVMKAGIATHYCDFEKINALEEEILAQATATDTSKILDKYTKESLQGKEKDFILKPHVSKINELFSANTVEEILQNLVLDNSEWSKKHYDLLQKMSPTSMKITLKLLRDGAALSLKDCLKMEYRVVSRVMEDHDFYEGVRAVIIDRDNSPKWKPSKLEDVSDSKVNSFFAPLPPSKELSL